MIKDIAENVTHSKVLSFADDTRVSIIISSVDNYVTLQSELNKIITWSVNQNMVLNPEKFEVIKYGKDSSLKDYVYMAVDSVIPQKSSIVDLGVAFDNDMRFCTHIDSIRNKANSLIGWTLCTFLTRHQNTMLTLLKSLILPKIDHGSNLPPI